jgi:hypothetical protein
MMPMVARRPSAAAYAASPMTITGRKKETCTPHIDGVERATLVFQLIDDGTGGTLQITNAENN